VKRVEKMSYCQFRVLIVNFIWTSVVCEIFHFQGRPVNVKHDARCVMGKVGGKTKTPNGENLIYCYKFALIH